MKIFIDASFIGRSKETAIPVTVGNYKKCLKYQAKIFDNQRKLNSYLDKTQQVDKVTSDDVLEFADTSREIQLNGLQANIDFLIDILSLNNEEQEKLENVETSAVYNLTSTIINQIINPTGEPNVGGKPSRP